MVMTTTDRSGAQELEILDFEHLGSFSVDNEIVVADPCYVESRFSGLRNGLLPVCQGLPVSSGEWQAFAVRSDDDEDAIDFLLACHNDELETEIPFGDVECLGVISVDTGRIAIVDAGHRDEESLQLAAAWDASAAGPCVLDGFGAIAQLPAKGVFPIYTSRGPVKRMLFVAFARD